MNYWELLDIILFLPPILFYESENSMVLEIKYWKLLEMLRGYP
jgi:hypothetical protein